MDSKGGVVIGIMFLTMSIMFGITAKWHDMKQKQIIEDLKEKCGIVELSE